MLDRDLTDLRATYGVALASADLLRRGGETAKATRVESLARIIARELQRRDPDSFQPEIPGRRGPDSERAAI